MIDLVSLARKFAGKWLAINADTKDVVADGSSAKEVLEAAVRAGVKNPIVFRVIDDYGAFAPWLE